MLCFPSRIQEEEELKRGINAKAFIGFAVAAARMSKRRGKKTSE
jgi:hypothetical protein